MIGLQSMPQTRNFIAFYMYLVSLLETLIEAGYRNTNYSCEACL